VKARHPPITTGRLNIVRIGACRGRQGELSLTGAIASPLALMTSITGLLDVDAGCQQVMALTI
jgi:hypothetical protein